MSKNQKVIVILIALIIVCFVSLACISGGDWWGNGGVETAAAETAAGAAAETVSAEDITATYGAEVFHAQLTGIANEAKGTPQP